MSVDESGIRAVRSRIPNYLDLEARQGQKRAFNCLADGMIIADIRCAVDAGQCTWLQVYETLINSGTSHATRRLLLDGQAEICAPVEYMLRRLFASGEVPIVPS